MVCFWSVFGCPGWCAKCGRETSRDPSWHLVHLVADDSFSKRSAVAATRGGGFVRLLIGASHLKKVEEDVDVDVYFLPVSLINTKIYVCTYICIYVCIIICHKHARTIGSITDPVVETADSGGDTLVAAACALLPRSPTLHCVIFLGHDALHRIAPQMKVKVKRQREPSLTPRALCRCRAVFGDDFTPIHSPVLVY